MKLLVDTHCWLWYLLSPNKLNEKSQALLQSQEHEVYLSAASAWEIVIKHGLGKLEIPLPPEKYIPSRLELLGHQSLPISLQHVTRVGQLPLHHKDPFDRVLIAQAHEEGMALLTADSTLRQYQVEMVWAGSDAAELP